MLLLCLRRALQHFWGRRPRDNGEDDDDELPLFVVVILLRQSILIDDGLDPSTLIWYHILSCTFFGYHSLPAFNSSRIINLLSSSMLQRVLEKCWIWTLLVTAYTWTFGLQFYGHNSYAVSGCKGSWPSWVIKADSRDICLLILTLDLAHKRKETGERPLKCRVPI